MSMMHKLTKSGHQPNIHILDNDASSILKQGLIKHKIHYQLLHLHLHRSNSYESAIQTFKAHFITFICATNTKYPAKNWDCFLPQSKLTLNFLRNCRFNPKLSAHVALHGIFYYNKTPLEPLGTRVLIHEKTTNNCTWASH